MHIPKNVVSHTTKIKEIKHQGLLEHAVCDLFPEAQIVDPVSGQYLELDLYLPQLKLAFEFQDAHHYVSWWRNQRPLEAVKQADIVIQERGETLIIVPCWWDGSQKSLIETIRLQRPELVKDKSISSKPIPEEAPQDFFKVHEIPGVGELMNASFSTSTQLQIDNWWMGEKYDGVRVCWNCEFLYSRKGSKVVLPQSCIALLPRETFIDGELWHGRGNYNDSSRIVLSSSIDFIPFQFTRIVMFDNPEESVQSLPFEKRYETLIQKISGENQLIILAPRRVCSKKVDLINTTQMIINDGGEGTMMRQPESPYQRGRSTLLLKFKAARGDREGLVVKVESDHVTLQLPDGGVFTTTVPKEFREELQPKKGDIISFSYQNFSKNDLPVDPKLYRIREDLSWKDVVQNFVEQIPQPSSVNDVTQYLFNSNNPSQQGQTKKPHAYWTSMKGKNMKSFFDKFAQKKNMDPLVPENWYPIMSRDIKQEKHGRAVLERWGGSLIRALMSLYPDIGLKADQFTITMRNYWKTNDKKREAMNEYAKKMGFDPLVPSNWYKVSNNEICEQEDGISYVLKRYFNSSLPKALVSLYPEIGLDPSKFRFKRNYWTDKDNRKKYFDDFAKESNFDPLIAENWYHISCKEMGKKSGGLLRYNNQSLGSALLEIYPKIGLDVTKFNTTLHKWYANPQVRKSFCDEFAATKKFNPLSPENWYSVSYRDFLTVKGGSSVLSYYNYKLSDLLLDVYPDIGLDRNRFLQRNAKQSVEAKRKFLEGLAKSKGMNPLDPHTWYQLSAKDIQEHKGGNTILDSSGSYAKTISMAFPEINLQEDMLKTRWFTEPQAIRAFCDEVAKSLGFDSLIPENWYSVTYKDFLNTNKGNAVLKKFNYVTADLLMSVYPDIGLERSQLSQKVTKKGPEYQRSFLCDLAEEKHFDPLDPQTWYELSAKDIVQRKGGSHILEAYGGYSKAIMALFPDIGVKEQKFKRKSASN